MSARRSVGTLALLGGEEWTEPCRGLDRELIEAAGATEVLVVPTAAAFEHPERVVERAASYFADLGVKARELPVLHRAEAEDQALMDGVRAAKLLYLADGSPLHLRSVLKGSPLLDAILDAYRSGAVIAASGAGATVLCDPMVDPRGGAYTVGLGIVRDLAVFPYHGTAAPHLRERSIELRPARATLVGVDAGTALLRSRTGSWSVVVGGEVSLYQGPGEPTRLAAGGVVTQLAGR